MRITVLILALLVSVPSAEAFGGQNPTAKVAVHVMSHESRGCSKNMPAISDCEDIVTTYSGCDDVDFFVVFYDLEAYTGFNYSVSWPAEWSSCSFTSCSEFMIGGIVEPGDGIAQTWSDCDSSGVCIAGFGWIGGIETSGYISVGPFPGFGIDISDCEFEIDTTMVECRAGVCGATGDDPCAGGDGGREGGGTEGGIRGYYKP
jgi:hypothetical protein